MSVALLPTRNGIAWSKAEISLVDAVALADHPLITEHSVTASRFLRDAGQPNELWATRIAAIAVVAGRRADTAPTIARRAAYLDVAGFATELLELAEDLHGVTPDDEVQAVLARSPNARLTKV